jgi:LysM repeat protein
MIADAMVGWRNPARYLAPLALAAAATATYVIVHSAVTHTHTTARAPVVAPRQPVSRSGRRAVSRKAKFYVVQPNDTLTKIAIKTGVSVTTLESLNPTVNPDALHPAQRLRLRQ